MRFLVKVTIPNHPFNSYVRDQSAGPRLQKILGHLQPEAVYFTDFSGSRAMIMVLEIADSSKIPAVAEPLFLVFNAQVEFHAVLTPDDLAKSGLDTLGMQWG